MPRTIRCFPHQGKLIQVPYLFPEVRFFFEIAGYACVSGDTLIETPSGKVRMDEFQGGAVVSYNEASGLFETDEASRPRNLGKDRMYRITLEDGSSVSCAGEHRLLTFDGWLPLSALLSEKIPESFYRRRKSVSEGREVPLRRGANSTLVYTAQVLSGGDSFGCISASCSCSSIKRIQYIGCCDKYDMHVAGNHNYVADGFINHNCGKTSSLVYAVFRCVKYLEGKHDREGKNPKIVIAGVTITFLKKTFSGALISLLDLTHTPYEYNKADNIMTVCGVQIFLIAVADEGMIFGYDVYAVFWDEMDELPTETSMAVMKALNDRARQNIEDSRPPFIVAATTSQGLKGAYQTYEEFLQKDISFILIRGATKDNTSLPPEYVQAMYRIYDDKETQCLLEGRFISVDSGLVFPQYSHSVHFLPYDMYQSLPDDAAVYLCQDFNQGSGFNKCLAVTAVNGVMYVVKNYEFPDWTKAPSVFRYDFPRQRLYWIPDMTFKDNFGMAARSLRAYGIKLILKSSNPLVSDRNVAINAAFHTNRLFVCASCRDVDKDLMMYQYDRQTGKPIKGKTAKAPDHNADCLGYGVYFIVSNVREFKDLFDVTINRFNRKRDEGSVYESDGLTVRESAAMLNRKEIKGSAQ